MSQSPLFLHEQCRSLTSTLRVIMSTITLSILDDLLYKIENDRQELPRVKTPSSKIIRAKDIDVFPEIEIKIQATAVGKLLCKNSKSIGTF